MEYVFCVSLILLFIVILCYPPSEDYPSLSNVSFKESPLVISDVPPEHDMVADRCKTYYLNPKDVQQCINSNCRKLCNGNENCFNSCSLWKLIRGE